jgi:hypothetical protein
VGAGPETVAGELAAGLEPAWRSVLAGLGEAVIEGAVFIGLGHACRVLSQGVGRAETTEDLEQAMDAAFRLDTGEASSAARAEHLGWRRCRAALRADTLVTSHRGSPGSPHFHRTPVAAVPNSLLGAWRAETCGQRGPLHAREHPVEK